MAVQSADKALDEWLNEQIKIYEVKNEQAVEGDYSYEFAYLCALKNVNELELK